MANNNEFRINDDAVKARLEQVEMTQRELAERIHVTANTVHNWLTGNTNCSYECLADMAEGLGVGMLDLTYNGVDELESRSRVTRGVQGIADLLQWGSGTATRLKKWLPGEASLVEPLQVMVETQKDIFEYYHDYIIPAPWIVSGFAKTATTRDDQLHQYGEIRIRPHREAAGRIELAGGIRGLQILDSRRKVIVKYGAIEWDEKGKTTARSYFLPIVDHGRTRDDGWIRLWTWLSVEVREFVVISPETDFDLEVDFTRAAERVAWNTASESRRQEIARFPPGPHHRTWAKGAQGAALDDVEF